jgi:hypothetical protein
MVRENSGALWVSMVARRVRFLNARYICLIKIEYGTKHNSFICN